MAWIALDCALGEHPKMADLPSDGARYGWVLTLLAAKRQAHPGRFASVRHYRTVLNGYAKHLPHYLAARLLEEDEHGALTVHDWQRYQWAAAKGRQREDKAKTNTRQEKDSRARSALSMSNVPVPREGERGERASDEPPWVALTEQEKAAAREADQQKIAKAMRDLGLPVEEVPA